MALSVSTLLGVIALLAAAVLWRMLRLFLVDSPFANIPGPPSTSWWKGNQYQAFTKDALPFHFEIIRKYGGVIRLTTLFNNELLYVSDPRALHSVIVKDQQVFEESSTFLESNRLVFGTSLLSTTGEKHRKQRKMLNPVFSTKHMRGLIDVFNPIAHELCGVIAAKVENGEQEIDMMKWISRGALEFIGQGGMGYEFNALDENKTNKYADANEVLTPLITKLIVLRKLVPIFIRLGPPAFRAQLAKWAPLKDIRTLKAVVDVMDDTSREIYTQKKQALMEGDETVVHQIGQGKDILSILLRANMTAEESERLPEEEVIGQINTFIAAGHETTTSALSRILHHLALHADAQEKLRAEVTKARQEGGDLDYDTLMSLPYLDAICRETLRVFPPAVLALRVAQKETILPLQNPIKSVDGKSEISEIFLKKGSRIVVSILGANINQEIWGPDAEEWKPERWLNGGVLQDSESALKLPGVYSGMMTFLGGSRACIGFKFAEMEIKVVLSILLESLVFAPSSEIVWSLGSTPAVKGSASIKPELPLRVSLVKRS